VNKNTVPSEPCSPFNPSGIRMGTPILSMRGMKEAEIRQVAVWMNEVSEIVKDFRYSETKEERVEQKKRFKEFISTNTRLQEIRKEVAELCRKFPIYK
jgi:glycine hydroxymethyltransferase